MISVSVQNVVVRRVFGRVSFLVDKQVIDHVEDEVRQYLWTFCWQVARWVRRAVE